MADAPAAPAPAAPGPSGGKGKVENPTTILILGLLTCNIFTIYWLWLRVKEINAYLGKEVINPLFVVPGCLCFPLLIYVAYLLAKAIPEVQKKAGVEAKDEFVVHFLLLWFVMPVGAYMVQQKLNEVWAK
jgi:hypothetical protein